MDRETYESLRSRLLVVQLLGSRESGEALSAAINMLTVVDRGTREESTAWSSTSADTMRAYWRDAKHRVEEYTNEVRKDIGTAARY